MEYRIAHLDYLGHVVARQIVTEINANELNKRHGVGSWVAVPVEQEVQWAEVAIENGKLVKAPKEVIAERLRIKQVAQREAIRVAREARYNSEEISSLYWNWVESGNADDKAKWIEAKEQVRKELPYPNN